MPSQGNSNVYILISNLIFGRMLTNFQWNVPNRPIHASLPFTFDLQHTLHKLQTVCNSFYFLSSSSASATSAPLHLIHIKPSLTFILAVLSICIRDGTNTSPTSATTNNNVTARLATVFSSAYEPP